MPIKKTVLVVLSVLLLSACNKGPVRGVAHADSFLKPEATDRQASVQLGRAIYYYNDSAVQITRFSPHFVYMVLGSGGAVANGFSFAIQFFLDSLPATISESGFDSEKKISMQLYGVNELGDTIGYVSRDEPTFINLFHDYHDLHEDFSHNWGYLRATMHRLRYQEGPGPFLFNTADTLGAAMEFRLHFSDLPY